GLRFCIYWPDMFFLLLRETLDSGTPRLQALVFDRWSHGPGLNHLGLDCGFGCPTFLQFLLQLFTEPFFFPILPAFAQRNREREACCRPHLRLGKRKCRADKKRYCKHAGRNNVSSGQTEIVNEPVPENSPQQTGKRDRL